MRTKIGGHDGAQHFGRMNDPRAQMPAVAAVYAHLLITLKAVARDHGYALGVHGSMTTDLDLIAAPWTDEAADPHALIEALRVSVDGTVLHNGAPTGKPHGRLAWSIYLGPPGRPYLDVSVMPRGTP